MGLETGTWISDFVLTNPTSGDAKSQGDDHFRLIKTILQTQFPESSGGVICGFRVASAQSASGTAIDFTSIPNWVKRITVLFSGVTTNGTSPPLVQIGDSGGIEFASYAGASTLCAASNSVTGQTFTAGFGLQSVDASVAINGTMTLTNITGNAWIASGAFGYSGSGATIICGGSKSLSATLDRVRITTVNATDVYDGGTVNILYE